MFDVCLIPHSFITLALDTVGRKKPLMFGAGSFVVTYSILTAIVARFPPEVNGVANTHHSAQRAGIAMIFLTSIFFSVSFGPVSWVLASEVGMRQVLCIYTILIMFPFPFQVFPTRTRSIGTSGNYAFPSVYSCN